MKTKRITKPLAILLALVMLLGMLPMMASADTGNTVRSTVFIQEDETGFLMADKALSVAADLSEDYGYTDEYEGAQATVMDALVAAHIALYGDEISAVNDKLAVNGSGFITKVVGVETSSLMFFVNGEAPGDGVYVEDIYSGGTSQTGYSATQALLSEGDTVAFHLMQDTDYYMDNYVWFEYEGSKVDELTVTAGDSVELSVQGYTAMFYANSDAAYQAEKTDAIEDAVIVPITNTGHGGDFGDAVAVTPENGTVTITFDTVGTHLLSAVDDSGYSPLMSPWLEVTVEPDPDDPLFGLDYNYGRIEDFEPIEAPQSIAQHPDFADGEVYIIPYVEEAQFSSENYSLLNMYVGMSNLNDLPAVSGSGSSGGRYVKYLSLENCYLPGETPEWRSVFGEEFYVVRLVAAGETHYILLSDSYTDGDDVYTIARAIGYSTKTSDMPLDATYLKGDDASAIEFVIDDYDTGDSDVGDVTYQWYASPTEGAAIDDLLAIEGATEFSYIPPTGFVGTTYYYLVITNTLDTGNTPSSVGNVISPLIRVEVKETPTWNEAAPQVLPFELAFGDATLQNITISGATVTGATANWIWNEDRSIYDYVYDVVVSSDTQIGDEITATFSIDGRSGDPLMPGLSRHSPRAQGEYYVTGFPGMQTINADLALNTTAFSENMALNGTAIEVFMYLDRTDYTPIGNGGRKFLVKITSEYVDPTPADVQSLSITTPPTKTEYLYGETFDPTDMVVTAQLTEGTQEVRGYTVTPSGALTFEDTYVEISYAGQTVQQEVTVSAAPVLISAEMKNGQFILERLLYKDNEADVVVLYGNDYGEMDISVPEGVEVELNGNLQTGVQGVYTLSLDTAPGYYGASNTLTLRAGDLVETYTITCHSQKYDGMPDAVVDYFAVNSQYTNGRYVGDFLQTYGLNGVASLVGSDGTTTDGFTNGPTSLGGYAGYITYYYEDPIYDYKNTNYGIDFVINGNSVEGSSAFAEPGQVWVSEDGDNWYALAGALHYENSTNWNSEVTYEKLPNGKTQVTMSDGPYESRYFFPLEENYPLFDGWDNEDATSVTLSGIALGQQSEVNEFGNTLPPFPDFGYADVGMVGEPAIPYIGSELRRTRFFLDSNDGMDLAWAVDANGQPVTFDEGIHYIKVQTATNIDNGGIGEKSTEINYVQRLNGAGADRVTAEPASIKVDGIPLALEEGVYVYNDVVVDGPFGVEVNAPEGADIYINAVKGEAFAFSAMPTHGIVRVIVQEDTSAPVIYILNLVETQNEPAATAELTLDPGRVGYLGGTREPITYLFDANMSGIALPIPYTFSQGYEFTGWYSEGQKNYTTYPAELEDITLTARWKYVQSEPDSTNAINVSFRLIGSTLAEFESDLDTIDLTDGDYKGAEYVTWIATRTYTMHEGDTVYDLFTRALDIAGLNSVGASGNYVRTIYAPAAYGGYELSEFTNGDRSGWMYTINGGHPLFGLKEQEINNGDVVVWHYVDDYAYEVADWDALGGVGYPAMGDSTYHNAWLKAADVNPPESDPDNGTTGTVAAEIEISGNTATAKVTAEQVAETLDKAKEEGKRSITIAATETGDATEVKAIIPTASAKEIADGDVALAVETQGGSVDIPKAALDSIVSQAEGDDIEISVAQKTVEDIADKITEQQVDTTDALVVEIKISSGDNAITSFGGEAIKIALPAPQDNKEGESYRVFIISDDGTVQEAVGTCVMRNGKLVVEVETTHLSTFVVTAESAWTNPFTDVPEDEWYYEPVQFIAQEGITIGKGDGTWFDPDGGLTRAEFVVMLMRAYGIDPDENQTDNFLDAGDCYYTGYLAAAKRLEISKGSNAEGTMYEPDALITRQDMFTLLYRALEVIDELPEASATAKNLSDFDDADEIADYAEEAMKTLVEAGKINGNNNKLTPKNNTSRAMMAQIFYNLLAEE